jgi:hypothetical protein
MDLYHHHSYAACCLCVDVLLLVSYSAGSTARGTAAPVCLAPIMAILRLEGME